MNFRKIISVLLLILLAACALCACQKSNQPNETAAEPDADLPELRIGVDILKPFFYKDENGNYVGIDADIAAEACRRAGYRPFFVKVAWDDRDSYLQNGNVDCLWNAFIKDGREDLYHWTDTYLQSNLRAIVDMRSPETSLSMSTLPRSMAVRAGSKLEDLLLQNEDNLPDIQFYSCGTFEMAETAFIKGYIGALGGHEAVLQDIIDSHPGLYRFLDGSLMTANLGVAFQKEDDSEHYTRINDAIQAMLTDGTVTQIFETYYSESGTAKEGATNVQN